LRNVLLGGIAAITIAVLTPQAMADVIYTLDTSNATGVSGPGPYAQVDVHLTDATHATATFTRLGSFTFGEMGLDINATTFGISGLTFVLAPTSNQTPSYTVDLGGKVGSVGNFALDYVDNPNGFSDSVISASFDIHNTSGTWADEFHVLNNTVPEAAVHAFNPNAPSGNNSFFASGGPTNCTDCTRDPTPVAEPATIALLGVGLLGLGFVRRRTN
jgi:hypothetical protein